MTHNLTTIGFDADDTLWHHEQFFRLTEDRFTELLSDFADPKTIADNVLVVEKRNLALYGFGVKGYTLSLIETAVELTGARVSAAVISEIIDAGRDMLDHPIDPLPHAEATLKYLAGDYRIVLITKGDLFHQERKLAASGLGDYFDAVEIVSDKTADTYRTLFTRHGNGPAQAMMIGNSLKSDVIPAIEAGSWGVHVPHDLNWSFDHADEPEAAPRYRRVTHLGDIAELIESLA